VEGEATGANFKVIAKAFRDLVRFRRQLSQELHEEKREEPDLNQISITS
jgi:hypothetical protein